MNELQERDVAEPFVFEQPTNGTYHQAAAPPPPDTPRRHRPRGIVGPTLLIGAGALLLLNTTGLVAWDIWMVLWRLWPVILIIAGLNILFSHKGGKG